MQVESGIKTGLIGFNRYIVECKSSAVFTLYIKTLDLIDT